MKKIVLLSNQSDENCHFKTPRFYEIKYLKPELTILICIHYKQQIAVAILALYWMKMTWSVWQIKKIVLLSKQFNGNFRWVLGN